MGMGFHPGRKHERSEIALTGARRMHSYQPSSSGCRVNRTNAGPGLYQKSLKSSGKKSPFQVDAQARNPVRRS